MNARTLALLVLLGAIWGGPFFFAEVALRELAPLTITLHRVIWAIPILAFVVWQRGIPLPKARGVWMAYLGMGALNNVIPFSLIFWGQTQINGGLASILNATTAMFGAVIAAIFLRDEPLTRNRVLGALIGLCGVGYIMGPDALASFSLGNLAQLAVLGAALSYSFAGVWGRSFLSEQPPLMNALGMLIGSAVLMIPLVFLVDGTPDFALSVPVWGALMGLSTLSTALAYLLYFTILARAGSANLMLVTLLIPPFAITLGTLFLGESLSATELTGFAIIALGFAVTDGRVFGLLR
jgi:drug/metabolite transporter (DMT)-like permease